MAENKSFDTSILKRIVRYIKPYKGRFYFTLFLTIFQGFFSPLRPLLIMASIKAFLGGEKNVLYRITEPYVDSDMQAFWVWTLIIIGTLVIESIVLFFQSYYSKWLGQIVIRDIQNELYRKLNSNKLSYFDRTPVGSLVTRVVSDIEAVSEIFSQGLLNLAGDILKLAIILVTMFIVDWKMSLIVLVPIPFMYWATRKFANAMKNAFQNERIQVNKLNTFVQEHLTGMAIVQIFNREKREMNKFKKINADHRQAHIDAVWAFSIFLPVVEIFSALSLAALVAWSIITFVPGVDSSAEMFAEILAFVMWISMLYRPLRQLADKFNVLQRGMIRAERVFTELDNSAQIEDTGVIEKENLEGAISFKDVHFEYIKDEPVLRGVSFDVKAGESVAFVGATGAGKSSIISLIARFYEFQSGRIEVDGIEIRDYKLETIRKNVSVVLQDVFLFSDTILNNITLKNKNISKETVIDAAKAIGAHDFIMSLPDGYDYNVRERGGMLSVGQRQLISFIRAYVYNPSILILDEATSSIDTESELLIQAATEKITKGRTSVMVAHRLSTIQKADRIIVLEKGEIIESGNHQELLAKGGHYKKLHDLQLKEQQHDAV